jgi:hypothetical protein
MHQICCSARFSHLHSGVFSFLVRSTFSASNPTAVCSRANKKSDVGRAAFHLATAPELKRASQVAVVADESRPVNIPSARKDDDAVAHVPVLLKEVIAQFDGRELNTYVDCTLGAGGHASAVLL